MCIYCTHQQTCIYCTHQQKCVYCTHQQTSIYCTQQQTCILYTTTNMCILYTTTNENASIPSGILEENSLLYILAPIPSICLILPFFWGGGGRGLSLTHVSNFSFAAFLELHELSHSRLKTFLPKHIIKKCCKIQHRVWTHNI